MSKAGIPIKVKATLKVAKYPEWATREDIEKGRVQPIEIVESEDDFHADKEVVNRLLNNK